MPQRTRLAVRLAPLPLIAITCAGAAACHLDGAGNGPANAASAPNGADAGAEASVHLTFAPADPPRPSETSGAHAGHDGVASTTATSTKPSRETAAATCATPIEGVDVSNPTTVVGNGPGTCTEAALGDALAKGGIITFDCGGPTTIAITTTKELPVDKDTVIDGGGIIVLDGGHTTRLLRANSPDFRATKATVALQHITLQNGKATGTMLPPAPPPCSQGFDGDASGGAIFARDVVLHVVDVAFIGNEAGSPGPDVGGGAVYALGSLDVTIVGSRFLKNAGGNGGAIGSLFSNLTLANDTFVENAATGSGANFIDPSCPVNGGEAGNGGNGGAIAIDGGEDFTVSICGATFANNAAGALGGAIFRTPDGPRAGMKIDRSTFDANTAEGGGGALYLHHTDLTMTSSTLSNNVSAQSGGAIQADDTDVEMTNVTVAQNHAKAGLGGGIALFGNGGALLNCTFAGNAADGGPGLFGGALAGFTPLAIHNTIFAGSVTNDCGAPMACAGGDATGDHVLQWPKSHAICDDADPPCAPGTAFVDPKLGVLADNGGSTKTILLDPGSPAIGAGTDCPDADQRGNPRAKDHCAAGAVEP